jgi:hypothetical protein
VLLRAFALKVPRVSEPFLVIVKVPSPMVGKGGSSPSNIAVSLIFFICSSISPRV